MKKTNLTPEQQKYLEVLLTRATSSYDAFSELHPSGRLKAGQPFLAGLLYSLFPVNTEEVETMAVDPKGRLYINFDRYMNKGPEDHGGIEHAGFCINHEPLHLLLNHHKRFNALPESDPKHRIPKNSKYWNYAADLSINQLINDHRPPDSYLMVGEGMFKHFPLNLTTEEYYALILDDVAANSCPDCGNPLPEDKKNSSENQDDTSSENSSSSGEQNDDSSSEKDDDNSSSSGEGESGGEKDDSSSQTGENSGSSDDEGDSGSSQDGEGNTETDGSSQNGEDGNHGSCKSCGQQNPPDCGSGAGGKARSWELGDSKEADGISDLELDDFRRAVAEKIKSQPGNHAGGMEIWADDYLKPPPYDWRKDLRANVKQGLTWKQGQADYQYKRPSRRNQNHKIVFPSLRAPRAKIAVGFDKSYSNLHNLGIVSQNIEQIAKKSGVRGQELLAFGVDVRADKVKFVNDPKQALKDTKGGGGTDMRVAFEVFEQLGREKKADIAILLTDLETGWPAEPPKHKMKYIVVGIVGDEESFYVREAKKSLAGWATLILINEAELY